ncbi:MAG: RagB/SusD family nutrient uptake outer membrane protein, partial [Mucilaginibacter sp.]
ISNFGYYYANPGLWYSYQAGDLRRAVTVIGPGDEIKSPGVIAKWGGIKGYPSVTAGYSGSDATAKLRYSDDEGNIINTCGTLIRPWYGVSDQQRSGYYNAKKWRDPSLTGGTGNQVIFGEQNQILMRYAEVLLSRAECKVRTGDAAGAMADLKIVRDRAFGGSAPAIMKDGLNYDGTPAEAITDPLQMVLSEYRHELTAEYSVFYLFRRAGEGVASAFIKKAYGTNTTATPQPYPYGPTADGKPHGVWITTLPAGRDLLPIPQQAIGTNPNLTQNPAYGK